MLYFYSTLIWITENSRKKKIKYQFKLLYKNIKIYVIFIKYLFLNSIYRLIFIKYLVNNLWLINYYRCFINYVFIINSVNITKL